MGAEAPKFGKKVGKAVKHRQPKDVGMPMDLRTAKQIERDVKEQERLKQQKKDQENNPHVGLPQGAASASKKIRITFLPHHLLTTVK